MATTKEMGSMSNEKKSSEKPAKEISSIDDLKKLAKDKKKKAKIEIEISIGEVGEEEKDSEED